MSTGLFYFAGENFGECEHSFLTVIGFVVHSLRRQRTNQESDLGAQPLRTRIVVACYTQKTLSHFLLNTRGFCRVQTLLSPPQKGRRKRRYFYGKMGLFLVGATISRPFQRETIFSQSYGVGAPYGRCSRRETAAKAKTLAKKFPKRFWGRGGFFPKIPLAGAEQRPARRRHFAILWGRGPIWTLLFIHSEQNR